MMASVALHPSSIRSTAPPATLGRFLPVAVVVGLAFYLTDHHFTTSTQEAFAGTAESYEAAAAGGNTARRLAFVSIAVAGSLGLLLPAATQARACGVGGLLLAAYLAWCLSSIVWSDDPGLTLRRGFVLICFSIGAVGMARRLTGRELLRLSLGLTTFFLGLGVLAELSLGTFRPYAGDYRFAGTLHPNTQGLNLAVLCLASALLARRSPRPWQLWALCGVGFVFLILTKSRTSTAAVVLSFALLWSLSTDPRIKLFAGLGGTWLASAALLAVLLGGIDLAGHASDVALMGREEQSESLTGRLPLWTQLSQFVAARPIAGYGYDSFWTPERVETVSDEQEWGIREAHNSYLDATLGTGLVGLGILVAAVLLGLLRAAATYTRTGCPLPGFVFALTVFALINACTESGMVMPTFVPLLLATGLLKVAFFPDFEADGTDPTARWDRNPAAGGRRASTQ